MSENPKDELIRKSGSLGISPAVAEYANPVQAEILLILNRQNESREATNRTIFAKLDAAAGIAALAAQTSEKAHDEVMGIKTQIDNKFQELNGSIGKTITRVGSLEFRNEESDKLAANQKIYEEGVREGKWIIPKEKRILIMAVWGWFWKIVISFFSLWGLISAAWPTLEPFLHRLISK